MTPEQAITGQASSEQTVDWADPAAVRALERLHRGDMWRGSLGLVIGLGLLGVYAAWRWLREERPLYFLAVMIFAALLLLRVRATLRRLEVAARASGVTSYRLEAADDTLHVHNALGDFHIPLKLIGPPRSYSGGLIVPYAGQSVLTLPAGPVCTELRRRLVPDHIRHPGGLR
ncbi:hypothetical protein [Deinococcus sp.]|uniref:hypothetical protein n=1 Tax=Deinococcus sp. TaxID=47478 RepID=UPI003CC67400